MVAREKSIHSRDVSTQRHLGLNTMGERYMCSFICKEETLCSRQEQHRARSFTRPLPLLHLWQKHIKNLHYFLHFYAGVLRTTEIYNSMGEQPGKAAGILKTDLVNFSLLCCHDAKLREKFFISHWGFLCLKVPAVHRYAKEDTRAVAPHLAPGQWVFPQSARLVAVSFLV